MNLTKSNLKKLALLIAGGIALNAALQHLDLVRGFFAMILGFLTPFLAGSALAFVINVPMRQIEGRLFPPLAPGKRPGRLRRAKRPISLLLTLLLLFGLLTIVFFCRRSAARCTAWWIRSRNPARICRSGRRAWRSSTLISWKR